MQWPRSHTASARPYAAAGAVQRAPSGPQLARFARRHGTRMRVAARAARAAVRTPATAGACYPSAAPATAPSRWSS